MHWLEWCLLWWWEPWSISSISLKCQFGWTRGVNSATTKRSWEIWPLRKCMHHFQMKWGLTFVASSGYSNSDWIPWTTTPRNNFYPGCCIYFVESVASSHCCSDCVQLIMSMLINIHCLKSAQGFLNYIPTHWTYLWCHKSNSFSIGRCWFKTQITIQWPILDHYILAVVSLTNSSYFP